MRRHSRFGLVTLTWLGLATFSTGAAWAHSDGQPNMVAPPAKLAVKGTLTAPPAGITDLKFRELFKLPVGDKGLEPSDKLLSLKGKRVRMVGYVANAEEATPGMFVLSPLPVVLGDEDEKLVDDLPPTAVFVHLSPAYAKHTTPNFSGLIQITGYLETGSQEEADGHMSTTRLQLDDASSRLLVGQKVPQKIAQNSKRLAAKQN